MCGGPSALAWSEASPSDPQSCLVTGHWRGLWPLGSPATLPLFLPFCFPSDASGPCLGVRGLWMRGHSSVTQARDTLNLGVATYYHPVFSSGIRKQRGLLPSGRERGLPSMGPMQKLNATISIPNWYISSLTLLLLGTRMCPSGWIKSRDLHSKLLKF